MEGLGPIRGSARELGWLIAGVDPIACEHICAELIEAKPEEFPILRTAGSIGFGCKNRQQISILGDSYENMTCPDFDRPQQIPIKFSLLRVLKSIGKQLFLLARPRRETD